MLHGLVNALSWRWNVGVGFVPKPGARAAEEQQTGVETCRQVVPSPDIEMDRRDMRIPTGMLRLVAEAKP